MVDPDGDTRSAGYAPYLDARPAGPDEVALVRPLLGEDWLRQDLEQFGRDYAIAEAVPDHLNEVRERTTERVTKAMGAVKERLTREVDFWDNRANVLREQMEAGKQPKMNPDRARARAEDLAGRLKRRLADLQAEEQLHALPPVVVGGALIVPIGLIREIQGEHPPDHVHETAEVERRAVDAVLAAEARLGRKATEMAHNNPGYDVRSLTPDGHLLFIEVKGRIAGAETVTITRNEILHGLNKPDHFILALVQVDHDDTAHVRYVTHPFAGTEDMYFNVTSVNYRWDELFGCAGKPS